MSGTALVTLAAAAIGYGRPRAKKKKLTSALLWAGLGWVAATKVAPQLGIDVDALRLPALTS